MPTHALPAPFAPTNISHSQLLHCTPEPALGLSIACFLNINLSLAHNGKQANSVVQSRVKKRHHAQPHADVLASPAVSSIITLDDHSPVSATPLLQGIEQMPTQTPAKATLNHDNIESHALNTEDVCFTATEPPPVHALDARGTAVTIRMKDSCGHLSPFVASVNALDFSHPRHHENTTKTPQLPPNQMASNYALHLYGGMVILITHESQRIIIAIITPRGSTARGLRSLGAVAVI